MPRLFAHLVALFLALTPMARAQDIPASSPMGLDYLDLTKGDTQLAAILLAGEAEWMASESAKDEYGEDLGNVWAENAVLLSKEKVTNGMMDELVESTPQTLLAFADLPEEKYPLLRFLGEYQKAHEELKDSEEILERSRLLCAALNGGVCPE